jgi:hypothetical protein
MIKRLPLLCSALRRSPSEDSQASNPRGMMRALPFYASHHLASLRTFRLLRIARFSGGTSADLPC